MKEKILVSSCLLGAKVRYHGGDARVAHEILDRWNSEGRLIPICPEVAGGLPTPRPPSEIQDGRVFANTGQEVTEEFQNGAHVARELVKKHQIKIAILKENSPSCGSSFVYDGSFSGKKIRGAGLTTQLLLKMGVRVFSENELEAAVICVEKLNS